jgi:3-hydroxyisobutyrate dehydrogenase-like beta-hydroxyacid dehydrogenase
MAEKLMSNGHQVCVFDIDDDRMTAMRDVGAKTVTSPKAAAARADVVCSSLPSADVVEEVYTGDNGLLTGADEHTLLIEMSTSLPALSERIHRSAREQGIEFLDAPVIGTPAVADAGNLTIMVGGTDSAFKRAKPVLSSLCDSIYHVGEASSGHKIKLLNNVIHLSQFAAAAEAFTLAKEVGVSHETLFEIINSGMAGSEFIEAKVGKALRGDFDAGDGFTIDSTCKDLKYALEMADKVGFSMATTASVKEVYTLATAVGEGQKDYSVLFNVLPNVETGSKDVR